MFYSHQLLARKAPLGQIWMAATLHAKINRRKLDKLNIIKICEQILYPSVPMALRLSSILMGGVVIVYERKVKLLYDDVNRLLVELNEVWKVKQTVQSDPTLLSKSKSKAKYQAVTLPDAEIGDLTAAMEHSLRFTINQQPEEYITMRLDQVDGIHVVNNEIPRDDNNHHQADPANITLMDTYDSTQADVSLYDRFERFDIEGDEDIIMNFATQDNLEVPVLIPSTPPQGVSPGEVPPPGLHPQQVDDEIQVTPPEAQVNQHFDECKEAVQQAHEDVKEPRATKRKARSRTNYVHMDFEQTIIPGNIYQTWLQDTSDLLAGRTSNKKHMNMKSAIKIVDLMDLPPSAILSGFTGVGTEVHYPQPLLDLYRSSTPFLPPHDAPSSRGKSSTHQQPSRDSPSIRVGRNLTQQPQAPSSPIAPAYQGPEEFVVDGFQSGVGVDPKEASIEKQVENLNLRESPVNDFNVTVTPGNSTGSNEKAAPSSTSGNGGLQTELVEQLLERSSRKRPHSSSKRTGSGGLDPVAEENSVDLLEPNFKLQRLPESGPFYDQEILMETGPTQTPHPMFDQPTDKMTDVVKRHLKSHFDTPGTSEIESLNQLTSGMNTKKAAMLFYQTCVLATHRCLKVKQAEPYGDILISRGPNM